ncbi:MAG: butyrate kinase, partial [Erysipelotrichaceae bacterium]|nr:butyrate kinase [Erysipelotrichaceae bacterium]
MYKIFAINLGSTSTKVAYYEDDQMILKKTIQHAKEDINACSGIFDQYDFRRRDIENFMKENGINNEEIDAFVSRGGTTQPLHSGTYRIDEDMLEEVRGGKYGFHPCSLGCQIAKDMANSHALPLTVDLPGTCDYNPLAFYSGMPEIIRTPAHQALNARAMAQKYAEDIGRPYEELNLLVSVLGGGTTVTAHEKGKLVDGQNGVVGDGAFSNNRCNAVPVGELVDMCYSGKYTYEQMKRKINGESGLLGYLGEMDTIDIERKALAGDKKYAEVLGAMCYQIAKDIGAYATVLNGKVDAILLIGGMANSAYITGMIKERVEFIAPVVVMPGEREMESLCLN